MTYTERSRATVRFAETLPDELPGIFDAAAGNIPTAGKEQFQEWLRLCRTAPDRAVEADRVEQAIRILVGLMTARLQVSPKPVPPAIHGRREILISDRGGAALVMDVILDLVAIVALADAGLAADLARRVHGLIARMLSDIEALA